LHVDTVSFQVFSFRKPIGHDLLNKLRQWPQELQLSHKPPRHEKNADTDPDGEQHRITVPLIPPIETIRKASFGNGFCNAGFLGNDLGTHLPESRPAGPALLSRSG
jgi:hypothetical protein